LAQSLQQCRYRYNSKSIFTLKYNHAKDCHCIISLRPFFPTCQHLPDAHRLGRPGCCYIYVSPSCLASLGFLFLRRSGMHWNCASCGRLSEPEIPIESTAHTWGDHASGCLVWCLFSNAGLATVAAIIDPNTRSSVGIWTAAD